MDNPNVPVEDAHEPAEEARQPLNNVSTGPSRARITFADDTDTSEKCSQKSIGYKEALSQPPNSFGHKQRLEWLQERRSTGLYVQCDSCDSWRYLPQVLDRYDLPEQWFCNMNPDKSFANCFIPEVPLHIREEEDLIHAEYSAGSVVWARMPGWPWWPAMVDDCPDAEEYYWLDGFSDIPTHYNVVFFDTSDVTRAWVAPGNLKPYGTNKNLLRHAKFRKYKKRLDVAMMQAQDANNMPLKNRLAKYSFISRYAGKISTPRKITQRDIFKFKAALKRKFNVDFPTESSSESELEVPSESKHKKPLNKRKNIKSAKQGNNETRSTTKKKNKTNDIKNKNVIMNDIDQKKVLDTNEEHNMINGINESHENEMDTLCNDMPENQIKDSLIENNIQEVEDESEMFVKPNSQAVQVGSTANDDDTCAIDNDSSTTYIPESQTENTMSEIINGLEVRVASPSSDDFDF